MAKNTSVTLGEHYDRFIAAQISDGHFGTASETIRAGLRLLEEKQHALAQLRQALSEGEQSGIVPYDYTALKALINEARQKRIKNKTKA